MKNLLNALVSCAKDESGPTAVEYAVMLALIIVVCITAITALGTNANNTFSYIGTNVGKVDIGRAACRERAVSLFLSTTLRRKNNEESAERPGKFREGQTVHRRRQGR